MKLNFIKLLLDLHIAKNDHKVNKNLDLKEKLFKEGKSKQKFFYLIDLKLLKELEHAEEI